MKEYLKRINLKFKKRTYLLSMQDYVWNKPDVHMYNRGGEVAERDS